MKGGGGGPCMVGQAPAWKNDVNSIPFSHDADVLCPWECGIGGQGAHIFLWEMPSALGRLTSSRSCFGWRKETDKVSLRAARCSTKAPLCDGLKSEFRSFLTAKNTQKKKKAKPPRFFKTDVNNPTANSHVCPRGEGSELAVLAVCNVLRLHTACSCWLWWDLHANSVFIQLYFYGVSSCMAAEGRFLSSSQSRH